VRRTVVHGVLCFLLIGVGVLAVMSYGVPWGAPGPLGFFGIAPLVVGGLGLVACIPASRALESGRRVPPLALLAAPLACLVLAGLNEAIVVPRWLSHCAEQQPGVLESPTAVLALEWAIAARARSALALACAGLGFTGCALAADVVPPEESAGRPLRTLRIVAIAWVVLLDLGASLWLLQRTASAQYLVEARGWAAAWPVIRENLGDVLVWGAWPLWLVPALAFSTAIALPLLLVRRTPRLDEIRGEVSEATADASALATAGTIGAGAGLALACWYGLSSRSLHFHWYAWTTDLPFLAYTQDPGIRANAMYQGGAITVLLLSLAALGYGSTMLLAMRARPLRIGLPVVMVLVALSPFVAARLTVGVTANRAFGPYCEQRCNNLDQVHAAFVLQRLQTSDQMDYDRRCGHTIRVEEGSGFGLPRLDVPDCPDVAVVLRVERDRVTVDGVEVAMLEEGRFLEEDIVDGWLHIPLHDGLAEKADEARAVADRNPSHPFTGRYNLAADARTPMATVDGIRRTALRTGFHDIRVVVAVPEEHDPPWLRSWGLDPSDRPDASSPPTAPGSWPTWFGPMWSAAPRPPTSST